MTKGFKWTGWIKPQISEKTGRICFTFDDHWHEDKDGNRLEGCDCAHSLKELNDRKNKQIKIK